mgnify:FL=1
MIVKKRLTVIQVLLFLIFVGCCGYLGKYFYDSHKAESGFDELKKVVEKTERADATDGYIDKRADNGMLECYYSLYQQNNDMVGWIKIPDTPVDYPVVKYSDNEIYLHKNVNKEYQFSGIPFLDYQSNDESVNKIIYAHNMKNGTMFASLADYEDKSFYDAHKNIMYDTLYDKGEYEIVYAFTTKVGASNEFKYYNYADIESEERFNEYVTQAKSRSFYDTGVNTVYGDSLITLSTCAYHTSNERFVVIARKK